MFKALKGGGGRGAAPITVFLKKKQTKDTEALFVGGDVGQLFADFRFSQGWGGALETNPGEKREMNISAIVGRDWGKLQIASS
jgi:hypothetical protein